MKGLKEKEVRKYVECSACHKKVGALPIPIFWIINAERHGLDRGAIDRQSGMEQMMGGSVALAQVMGANEDFTKPLADCKLMVCDQCLQEKLPEVFVAAEYQAEKSE